MVTKERLSLEELCDQITLLLHELEIIGDLLYESLHQPMTALKSGRSPKALGVEEQLSEPQELANSLGEVLEEFNTGFREFSNIAKNIAAPTEELPNPQGFLSQLPHIQSEYEFWREFQNSTNTFLKRLQLLCQESQLSSLGKMSLDEIWQDIESLAQSRPANV